MPTTNFIDKLIADLRSLSDDDTATALIEWTKRLQAKDISNNDANRIVVAFHLVCSEEEDEAAREHAERAVNILRKYDAGCRLMDEYINNRGLGI